MRALKFLIGTAMLALAAGGVNAADDGTFTINIQGPQDSAATVSQGSGNDFQEAPLPQRQTTSNTRQRSRNTSASGTQQRQNTATQTAANRQSNAAATRTAQPRSASQAPAASAQTATAAPAAASSGNGESTRYNVRATDTLWSIATRHLPADRSVNEFQIVAAIYRNNPASFAQGNVNRLLGGTITIPPLSEIRREDPATGSRLLERGTLQMPALAPAQTVSTAQPAATAANPAPAQESTSENAHDQKAEATAAANAAANTVPEFQATENVVSDARKQAQEELEQKDANALSESMGSAGNRTTTDNEAAAAAAADAAKAAADGAKILGISDKGSASSESNAFKMNGDEEQAEPLARLDNDTIKVMLQGSQKQIDLKMREIDRKLMQAIERMQKANETVTTSSDATVASLAKQYDSIIAGLQQTVTELKGQIAALDRDNTNMREMLLATDEKLESLQVKLADGKVGVSDSGDYQRSLTMIIVGIGLLSLLLLGLFVIFRIKNRARNRSVESELAEDVEDNADLEDDTLLSSTVSSDSEEGDGTSEEQDAWNKAAAEAASEASAETDEPPENPDDSKTAMEMWSKAINEKKKSESKSAEVGSPDEGSEQPEEAAEEGASGEAEAEDGSAAAGEETAAAEDGQEASSDEDTMEDWAAALAEQEGAAGTETAGASADEQAAEEITDAVDADDEAIAVEEREEIQEPQIVPEVPESEQDLSKYIGDRGSEWVSEMDEKQPEPQEMPEPTPTPEELAAQAAQAMEQQKQAQLDEDLKQYLGGSGSEWVKAVDDAKEQTTINDISSEDIVGQVREEHAATAATEDNAGNVADEELSGEAEELSQALKDHSVPKTDASAEDPASADAEDQGTVAQAQPSDDDLLAAVMGDEAPAVENAADDAAVEAQTQAPSAQDESVSAGEESAGVSADDILAEVQEAAESEVEAPVADEALSQDLTGIADAADDATDIADEVMSENADVMAQVDDVAAEDTNAAAQSDAEDMTVGTAAEPVIAQEVPELETIGQSEDVSADEAMLAEAMAQAGDEDVAVPETADETVPAEDNLVPDAAAEISEQLEPQSEEVQLAESETADEMPADTGFAAESEAQDPADDDLQVNEPESIPQDEELVDITDLGGEAAADEALNSVDAAAETSNSEDGDDSAVTEEPATEDVTSDEAHLAQVLNPEAPADDEPLTDATGESVPEDLVEVPAAEAEVPEVLEEPAVTDDSAAENIESNEADAAASDVPETETDGDVPATEDVDDDDVIVELSDNSGKTENSSSGDPIADEFAAMLSDAREEQAVDPQSVDPAELLAEANDGSGTEDVTADTASDDELSAAAADASGAMPQDEESVEIPEETSDEMADSDVAAEPETAMDDALAEDTVEISATDLPGEVETDEDAAEAVSLDEAEEEPLSASDLLGEPAEDESAEITENGETQTAVSADEATPAEAEDEPSASDTELADISDTTSAADAAAEEMLEIPAEPQNVAETLPEELSEGVTVQGETEDPEIPVEDNWERLESAVADDESSEHADLSPFKWTVPEDDGFDDALDANSKQDEPSQTDVPAAKAAGPSAEESEILNMLGEGTAEDARVIDEPENASGELSEGDLLSMISQDGAKDSGEPAALESEHKEPENEPELTDEEYQYLSDSLGLARLYFETGDLDEARKILDLVEKRGNLGLRQDARALREEYDKF